MLAQLHYMQDIAHATSVALNCSGTICKLDCCLLLNMLKRRSRHSKDKSAAA